MAEAGTTVPDEGSVSELSKLNLQQDVNGEGVISERDENKCPQHNIENPEPKGKRLSSSGGLPTGRRLSSSGTPNGAHQKLPSPRISPRIQPRETRSSILRKSLSGSEKSLHSPATPVTREVSSNALSSELHRLRDDVLAKDAKNKALDEEVAALRSTIVAKDRALSRSKAEVDAVKEKVLQAEGELSNKARETRALEGERGRLSLQAQGLEREADKLRRQLSSAPRGTGLSETVATLEAEIKTLKAENSRLEDDSKGVYTQLRAKDKQIDIMTNEVAKARDVHMQNQELDNYILDLRRQLQDGANERASLIKEKRQNKELIAEMTEGKEENAKEMKALQAELANCRNQLKVSQEHASALSKELDMKKTELARVGSVANRALVREVGGLKEEGTVPYAMHKDEVAHLKGENERIKEKLRLSEKSAAATQQQVQKLYQQLDTLRRKT